MAVKSVHPAGMSVLIPDGYDQRAVKVVQSLGVAGGIAQIVVTTKNSVLKYSRYCKTFFVSDCPTEAEISKAVEEICSRYDIDVAVPSGLDGINYISNNTSKYPFLKSLTPSSDTLALVHNKWSLYNVSKQLEIDSPYSILLDTTQEAKQLGMLDDRPVLLKPTTGAGGDGIRYFQNPRMLARWLKGPSRSADDREYIVQEYIAGSNIDISVLCRDGNILACTMQKPIEHSHETFRYSGRIEFFHDSRLLETCERMVRFVKWNGVAHLDFLLEPSSGRMCLIDFNPRFWGTLAGSTLAGVNFPYLYCLASTGTDFPVPDFEHIRYYELNRREILSSFVSGRIGKEIPLRMSSLYFFMRDPLPTIMKNPARLR